MHSPESNPSVPAEAPAWWKEAVVYQVYPRSFADSNSDGIGDLPGITGRLDYLQRLGVDAVWLSPIFASPNDDNGYDISDYLAIGPEYGTLNDFNAMVDGLKSRGLRLVLDQVLNHTSDEHAWFQQSRSSRNNPKRDWYHWVDPKSYDTDGSPIVPNNWKSVFEGSAWQWDAATRQYYLHMFSWKQPDLNWRNPAVRQALYDVLRTWAQRGVDGFRLDVINMVAKTEGYPDVPRPEGDTEEFLALHHLACNQPPIHDYLQEMHRAVLAGTDLYAVGETWWIDHDNTLEFTGYDRHELHGAFYFYFHTAASGREQFKSFYKLYQATRGRSWLTVTLGNHDSRRILSKFGDPMHHRHASATLLATWLLSLPATPFLFQGEELGLTDVAFDTIDEHRDIATVNRYHVLLSEGKTADEALAAVRTDSRDNSRTPMPWADTVGAGFSSGKPWISPASHHRAMNAADAMADPDSIFNAYAALIALRKEVRSLVYGDLTPITDAGQVIAYRRGGWEGYPPVHVILNWGSVPQPWPVSAPIIRPLFSNYSEIDPLTLRPWEAVIFSE